jgi:hypothetical protein
MLVAASVTNDGIFKTPSKHLIMHLTKTLLQGIAAARLWRALLLVSASSQAVAPASRELLSTLSLSDRVAQCQRLLRERGYTRSQFHSVLWPKDAAATREPLLALGWAAGQSDLFERYWQAKLRAAGLPLSATASQVRELHSVVSSAD